MEFKPLTEQEIKEMNLLPEGTYDFEVLSAQHKTASTNREYFNLKLRLSFNGKEKVIFDGLYFEGAMFFKTKHFCEATGLEKQYNAGKLLPPECEGRKGKLELIRSVNKRSGEMENRVKDYIVTAKVDEFNDSIPF